MTRVITIGREYGSGGGAVARILGERLGWRLIDDALIASLARSLRASPEAVRKHDECVDPWFHRIVKSLWQGGFEGAASRIETSPPDADEVARLWNRVILDAAEMGECVAVGRGAQCLLHNRHDAFHVYIYAPMSERVRRLRDREPPGTDLAARARERDLRRAAYIRHYFNRDWTNPHMYHLMVCTSIGLERAADAILCGAGLGEKAK